MPHCLRISWLLLAALASACTGLGPSTPDNWKQQQAQRTALTHFVANGKIALRVDQRAESASLMWRQQGGASHLRLQGPLGIGTTTVDSDGEVIEVRRGEDIQRWTSATATAPPPWDLPLPSLPYWLRGVPNPDGASARVAFHPESGQLETLTQGGWTVVYIRYEEFDGVTLPTRLEVSREQVWARIILRDWEVIDSDG